MDRFTKSASDMKHLLRALECLVPLDGSWCGRVHPWPVVMSHCGIWARIPLAYPWTQRIDLRALVEYVKWLGVMNEAIKRRKEDRWCPFVLWTAWRVVSFHSVFSVALLCPILCVLLWLSSHARFRDIPWRDNESDLWDIAWKLALRTSWRVWNGSLKQLRLWNVCGCVPRWTEHKRSLLKLASIGHHIDTLLNKGLVCSVYIDRGNSI